MRQWLVFGSLIFAIVLTGCQTWPLSRNKAFSFALIGDVPYNDEQFTNLFPNMIRELNQAKIEFVVNLDATRRLGVTIAPALLARATRVLA